MSAADRRAGERVGDQALAGVRATANGRHEQRLARDLGPQLAEQPAMPIGVAGIRCAELGGQRHDLFDSRAQLPDAGRPRGERALPADRIPGVLHCVTILCRGRRDAEPFAGFRPRA
jgi:hypothetical protein